MPTANRCDDERERLEQEAVDWMVRLASGEATDSDRSAAQVWRRLSPAHDQALTKVERLWAGVEPLRGDVVGADDAFLIRSPWSRWFSLNMKAGARPRAWIQWGAIAASFAAVIVTLVLTSGVLPLLGADVRTGTGEQLTIPLEDGSEIVLNTQAAVSIRFSGDVRRVDLLAGEAAFRVENDAARPFVVHAQEGRVRAVGTAFLVREAGSSVIVTVTEGVVDVSASGPYADHPTRVQAGQRVRYSASGVSAPEPVDLRVATAWQRGKLLFEAAPLATVVQEINRYRPGRVVLLNDVLSSHPVSGVFDLDRLETAVTSIEQTLSLTAIRFTNRFVLFR